MVASQIDGVGIAGIVSAVPAAREGPEDLASRFGAEAAARLERATGIRHRPVAPPDLCTSDLAAAAAGVLLERLDWDPASVDLLVFVTQTPDQMLPGNACHLHRRLGLAKRCAVFDLSLGCSGFLYGLWTAAGLLRTVADGRRALLLAGDTTARLCPRDDRAVAPLFGDAAAATALEAGPAHGPLWFDLGSDGTGAPYLAVAGGGMREPERERRLFMDGTQVFAFTLREVPGTVARVLEAAGWTPAAVDAFVFHQANAQMIRHLGQKIGARPEQVVLALAGFGNTSSASIPLALTAGLGPALARGPLRLVLSGFGVGWSWASAALATLPLQTGLTVTVDADRAVRPLPDPS